MIQDILLVLCLVAGWYILRRERLTPYQKAYRNGYLKSEHWQEVRKRKLKQAGYKCEACGAKAKLDIHHLTYIRIGRERLSDLQALCRPCHVAAENRKRGEKMSKKLSIWIFLFTLILASVACRVPIASAKIEHAPKVGQATPEVGQEADRQMTVCNSGGLNVRRGAGTDNQVMGIIPDGTIVTLTGREETPVITTWYEVQAGELVGWVFGRYLCDE